MKEKDTTQTLEDLKDRKIEEDVLEDVAGGEIPGASESLNIDITDYNSKPFKGGLSSIHKKK